MKSVSSRGEALAAYTGPHGSGFFHAGCRALVRFAVASLLFSLAGLASSVQAAEVLKDEDCMECHSDKELVATNAAGKVVSMYTDLEAMRGSGHSEQSCIDCHADIKELPHDEQKLKPVDCAACHEDAVKEHKASLHGRALENGNAEAATCADCHGHAHALLSASQTNAPTHHQNVPHLCASCHGDEEAMAKFNLTKTTAVVTYEHSVHGLANAKGNTNNPAVCSDCHGVHNVLSAGDPASKLYWRNVPATCGKCHGDIQKVVEKSIHGQGALKNHRDAPVCTDCHGEHNISAVQLAESSVAPAHIQETCGQCHNAERIAVRYGIQTNVFDTYVQSFHGLAAGIGGVSAANCASCHGYHDIQPSSDPASSVHVANLPKTCGKCHPGIGTRLASGEMKIHESLGEGKTPEAFAVMLVTRIYLGVIIVVVGGMALHNLLDYISKLRAHVRAVRRNPGEHRLTRIMRIQHILLIVTFVILAYTGFVHKFPDAWWSWPYRAVPDGSFARGLWHRIAGWIFTGVFAAHLVMLFGTERGRTYLKVIWLNKHDGVDFWRGCLGYLRLRAPNHPHRRFNFAEKAEYWALVWGSFVMVATGIMLIFTEATLRFLPKVWLDLAMVIHLYEAVLATLAIVVWHFYWVIFDPKEYPMNPAWLIGNKAPHKADENDPYHDGPSI